MECLEDERALNFRLVRAFDVLDLATPAFRVDLARWRCAMGRRLENLDEMSERDIFFDLPDLDLHRLAGQDFRNEDHPAVQPRKPVASMDQFFDCDSGYVARV
jgi:hypothetical protein